MASAPGGTGAGALQRLLVQGPHHGLTRGSCRGAPLHERQHFWARGYFVSTVGRDEAVIREYFKNQEREDQRLEQLNLWR